MTLQRRSYFEHELQALYEALLSSQARFDTFRRLLLLYKWCPDKDAQEPPHAEAVRCLLNDRVRSWIGEQAHGLSALQAVQWRGVVAERPAREHFGRSMSIRLWRPQAAPHLSRRIDASSPIRR